MSSRIVSLSTTRSILSVSLDQVSHIIDHSIAISNYAIIMTKGIYILFSQERIICKKRRNMGVETSISSSIRVSYRKLSGHSQFIQI